MAYKIVYKKSVYRDLKQIDKKEIRRLLEQLEKNLSEKAESYPLLKGQFAGLRKYRVGNYQIIYAILGTDVIILRVGHRRDIYKKELK